MNLTSPNTHWVNLATLLGVDYTALDAIYAVNTTGAEYHNPDHMKAVAVLADYLYLTDCKYYKTKPQFSERTQLFFAASLHDLGHQGNSVVEDKYNVERSVELVKRIGIDSNYYDVLPAILCTVYDKETQTFPVSIPPGSPIAPFLRDADLLLTLVDTTGFWLEALSKETGQPMTLESSLRWLRKQICYTCTGRKLMVKALLPTYAVEHA